VLLSRVLKAHRLCWINLALIASLVVFTRMDIALPLVPSASLYLIYDISFRLISVCEFIRSLHFHHTSALSNTMSLVYPMVSALGACRSALWPRRNSW
jgi:hypothetical protein